MKCPGCASEMKAHVVLGVEIDTCTKCGGILLDKGETEAIETLGVARIIEGTVNRSGHQHPTIQASGSITPTRFEAARCYECDREMIALTGAGDVEYDWCDNCERIFFDRGELSALESFKSD